MSTDEGPNAIGELVAALEPTLSAEAQPLRSHDREAGKPAVDTQSREDVRGPGRPATGKRGSFFAIDHRCWAQACATGMNAAVAYLVQARGTGRDQRTTAWSVQAVETYTGISRNRAKVAINALQSVGLTSQIQGGSHPRYELPGWSELACQKLAPHEAGVLRDISTGKQPGGRRLREAENLMQQGILEMNNDGAFRLCEAQWIWLPNEFVTGAHDETPPLELLRQTQDVMALRLAVDLYHAQNLRDDGGVSRTITWQRYERFEVGRQGQFTVWGFRQDSTWVTWTRLTKPHFRDPNQLFARRKKGRQGRRHGVLQPHGTTCRNRFD